MHYAMLCYSNVHISNLYRWQGLRFPCPIRLLQSSVYICNIYNVYKFACDRINRAREVEHFSNNAECQS